MRERSWLLGTAAVAVLVALVFALGAANPLAPPHITTDALGPEGGESTSEYLQRAAESLEPGGAGAGDAQRWALVSFVATATADAAATAVGEVRISQATFFAPSAGGQGPFVTVATPASADPAALLTRAQAEAASQLEANPSAVVPEGLRSGVLADLRDPACACVLALLVRAEPEALRAIAGAPGVQAVEALPADAVFGRFAVRPLIQTTPE